MLAKLGVDTAKRLALLAVFVIVAALGLVIILGQLRTDPAKESADAQTYLVQLAWAERQLYRADGTYSADVTKLLTALDEPQSIHSAKPAAKGRARVSKVPASAKPTVNVWDLSRDHLARVLISGKLLVLTVYQTRRPDSPYVQLKLTKGVIGLYCDGTPDRYCQAGYPTLLHCAYFQELSRRCLAPPAAAFTPASTASAAATPAATTP